jgi:hypothetical protein
MKSKIRERERESNFHANNIACCLIIVNICGKITHNIPVLNSLAW